ncbi:MULTISPECIES: Hint domain-containing protein [Asaia]|uniref:Hint domain-containing protein n=1 Tax=Asaia TaxID=91914 RepID=UPI002FC395A2
MATYDIGKESYTTGSGDSAKTEQRGKTVTGWVLKSGDTLNVNDWGTATNCTVDGGTVNGNSGGTINNGIFKSGTVNIQGATVNGGTMSGGLMVVKSGSLRGTFNMSGGKLTIGNSNSVIGSGGTIINLSASAMAAIYNVAAMTVNLGNGTSLATNKNALKTLTINATGESFNLDIEDLDPKTITKVDRESNRLIIHTTNGDVTINGSIPGYKFSSDGKGGLTITACFAKGTLISTPDGARPVEALKIGDLVDTDIGPQAVQWVGYKHVHLHGATPDEAHLVHIRAHAFDAMRPSRDLWVTPEHCVEHDGGLTPIRMLVNGGSIAYDRQKRRFTYYHVEVPHHAIMLAENLGMESYLAGQNISLFDNKRDTAVTVPHTQASRLPLIVDRTRVEPFWKAIAERSVKLGYPSNKTVDTVGSTNISLMTVDGRAMPRVDHMVPGEMAFLLPPETQAVKIMADAKRPDQAIGPFIDDRRVLGVRVGAVYLQGLEQDACLTAHLTAETLGGWNNIEDGQSRWTSDEAILPLPKIPVSNGSIHLVLELPDMR